MCYYEGRKYGFGGLLTKFFRWHRVEDKELDYKPVVDTLPIDVITTRSTAEAQGPILTMFEHQPWTDEITARMYVLQVLYLRIGVRPATNEEIHIVELNNPLGHRDRILLRIRPDFVETIDNDVSTDEERQWCDSDIDSDDDEKPNKGDEGDANHDADDANNDIAEA
ncbi:uncharacterized protein LOC107842008 [Capsicum annuum]|uniref:uncharacterized protein LOC107842008 n=1 Tax=Capsicum annuum TaxID=4072 RepID=UPI0007BEEC90|nr:uncharacterized protein LOC107842008 [Capsicum annuum]